MKILHVITALNRGGAETLLMNIYRNIDREKYKFYFLVFEEEKFEYEDEIIKLGGKIFRMKSPKETGMLQYITVLKQLLKREEFDVVHAHNLFNCGPTVFAAYLAGIKVRISHSHTNKYLDENRKIKKKIYYILSKFLINIFSTNLIACSEQAGNFLFYKLRKFRVLKNGININKFKFDDEKRNRLRNRYKIENDTIVIGHVGRFNNEKNHSFLIKTFHELLKLNNNIKLMLVGNGELENEIKNMVNDLNLMDKILFLGSVENVNEIYNAFDIFVFPSKFEGLGIVLIEAQCNGLPIIASDTITQEVNISNQIKYISLEKQPQYWAEAIYEKSTNKKRANNLKLILDSGYLIQSTVKDLEKIYTSKLYKNRGN